MPRIPIVNEKDEIIGYKERNKIKSKDVYRVSALWIKNSKNQALLARRALTKKNDPGKWGPSVAGTIDKGESYKENIIKETKEELGLKNILFKKGPKVRITGKHNFFCQWYILRMDKNIREFNFEKSEVEEIKWFDIKELNIRLKQRPEEFIEGMKKYIKVLI